MRVTEYLKTDVELESDEQAPILRDPYNSKPIEVRSITITTSGLTYGEHSVIADVARALLDDPTDARLDALRAQYEQWIGNDEKWLDLSLTGYEITTKGKRVQNGAGWHHAYVRNATLVGVSS